MPGFFMHEKAVMTCPHLGTITIPPGPVRVMASLNLVSPETTILTVAGCPFTVPTPGGPKPQPCVTVQWKNVSARVKVNGLKALLQATPPTSPGGAMCFSVEQIPQGPPVVQFVQTRVMAM
jgi:hypothetical protein